MTQNEIIWAMFGLLQGAVFMFIAHWTRRVQDVEKNLAASLAQRETLLREFERRVSSLEAESRAHHAQEMQALERIERWIERREEREDDDNG